MSGRAAAFRQADVARAIKAAEGAGLKIGRVDISATGTISIVPAEKGKEPGRRNPMDRFL